jgi:hypothetical protein
MCFSGVIFGNNLCCAGCGGVPSHGKESGVALFLAISASAAVPIAPFVVTKTGGMVPSDVAKAAALLAG